jgi:Flp pilus assembly protein TadD
MGGHRQEAIDELTKGIELAPKSSDGHNIYGVILARMGKLDEAIAELQKAVDLAPQSAECRFNLGRAFAASNRFADALPQFEAAAQSHRRPGACDSANACGHVLGDRPVSKGGRNGAARARFGHSATE